MHLRVFRQEPRPLNPIEVSLKYDDSVLRSAMRYLEGIRNASQDFLKNVTDPSDKDVFDFMIYYMGFGDMDAARRYAARLRDDAELRIDYIDRVLSVPRASSIEDFFRRATAGDIIDFLAQMPEPELRAMYQRLREIGEMESAKVGGKPVELRPPELKRVSPHREVVG